MASQLFFKAAIIILARILWVLGWIGWITRGIVGCLILAVGMVLSAPALCVEGIWGVAHDDGSKPFVELATMRGIELLIKICAAICGKKPCWCWPKDC